MLLRTRRLDAGGWRLAHGRGLSCVDMLCTLAARDSELKVAAMYVGSSLVRSGRGGEPSQAIFGSFSDRHPAPPVPAQRLLSSQDGGSGAEGIFAVCKGGVAWYSIPLEGLII